MLLLGEDRIMDQAQKLRQMIKDEPNDIKKPRIITVTSGKGGVGKSNVVVNLAILLQKFGKKVMIFDADIGMSNDDVLMGFLPKYNIFDIILNNKDIEEVIIEGPYGVKLLPGGSGLSKVGDLDKEDIEKVVYELEKINDLDFIIIDTGAGINRSVLGFIACCDELIIVTTPEPTSLTDAYCLLKAVNHFNLKSAAKIIINRVNDDREGTMTYSKFSKAVNAFLKIDIEYLGCIYEDRKLVQAVKSQQPLVTAFPTSEAAKSIENIAKSLIGNTTNIESIGIKGLFRKILNNFS
jgi:flagellar biosynthesis protein FlhG